MKANLGETHLLVQLTLDCLEYDQEDRPSAVMVLQKLEEVRTTLPQNCTQTKLELIWQKEELEIQLIAERAANEKQTQIDQLQYQIFEKDTHNTQLQASINGLQAKNREQVLVFEELITLQQTQLEVQRREIDCLSCSVGSLQIQPQEDQAQSSGQAEVTLHGCSWCLYT